MATNFQLRDILQTRHLVTQRQHCAVPKSRGKSNMEVIVGTYEQVLVGFDVLFGEDELEVTCEHVKCNLENDFLFCCSVTLSCVSSSSIGLNRNSLKKNTLAASNVRPIAVNILPLVALMKL